MRHALVFCMMLFMLNSEVTPTPNKSVAKQTCSLGAMPKLQTNCVKKIRKERLRCRQAENYLKQAFDNTLHFINGGFLSKLIPFLK